MSVPQTIPAVSATAGTPTPVFTGAVTAAVSFSIANGLATIVLGSLPAGYEPGKQVTLWGFSTATYFNGKAVTVSQNNPALFSFSFPFTHANVASTDDTGNTAPAPVQKFRGVRLEADKGNSSEAIYVGDGSVSASQYTAQLLYGGDQQAIWFGGPEVAAQNVDASRIFIDSSNTGAKVQVSLFY
jgi:hypothetical protein